LAKLAVGGVKAASEKVVDVVTVTVVRALKADASTGTRAKLPRVKLPGSPEVPQDP
jgi:hypothetical protein